MVLELMLVVPPEELMVNCTSSGLGGSGPNVGGGAFFLAVEEAAVDLLVAEDAAVVLVVVNVAVSVAISVLSVSEAEKVVLVVVVGGAVSPLVVALVVLDLRPDARRLGPILSITVGIVGLFLLLQ